MSKYALISLTNKDNLELLVSNLVRNDFKIIATTSTAKEINNYGYETIAIDDIASFPEILDGRVKTLQPEIHAGILANLNNPKHIEDLKKFNVNPISLVVCNLYEFKKVLDEELSKDKLNDESKMNIIEHIDIGGITLIRAAAKNYLNVSLLCDPSDYQDYVERLNNDDISIEYRESLAMKGFMTSANYDSMIANYFMSVKDNNDKLLISSNMVKQLRYGENPHQKAYWYQNDILLPYSMNSAKILQGKELSYNNLLDIDAAFSMIKEFDVCCAIAFKHTNPCGVGWAKTIEEAYQNCFDNDPISIFGGIVIVNRNVSKELALKFNEIFLEIIIAPSFSEEAIEILSKKKNLRLIKGDFTKDDHKSLLVKSINGGYLVQDDMNASVNELEQVTKEWVDLNTQANLLMLNKIVKHVKSNAIVIGQRDVVLGICGGMVNRIDALKIALSRALSNSKYDSEYPLQLVSDGFFPFNDVIDYAIDNNIKYILQPGGSLNDEKLIEACNENGIGMVFSHVRFFKH